MSKNDIFSKNRKIQKIYSFFRPRPLKMVKNSKNESTWRKRRILAKFRVLAKKSLCQPPGSVVFHTIYQCSQYRNFMNLESIDTYQFKINPGVFLFLNHPLICKCLEPANGKQVYGPAVQKTFLIFSGFFCSIVAVCHYFLEFFSSSIDSIN